MRCGAGDAASEILADLWGAGVPVGFDVPDPRNVDDVADAALVRATFDVVAAKVMAAGFTIVVDGARLYAARDDAFAVAVNRAARV